MYPFQLFGLRKVYNDTLFTQAFMSVNDHSQAQTRDVWITDLTPMTAEPYMLSSCILLNRDDKLYLFFFWQCTGKYIVFRKTINQMQCIGQ